MGHQVFRNHMLTWITIENLREKRKRRGKHSWTQWSILTRQGYEKNKKKHDMHIKIIFWVEVAIFLLNDCLLKRVLRFKIIYDSSSRDEITSKKSSSFLRGPRVPIMLISFPLWTNKRISEIEIFSNFELSEHHEVFEI